MNPVGSDDRALRIRLDAEIQHAGKSGRCMTATPDQPVRSEPPATRSPPRWSDSCPTLLSHVRLVRDHQRRNHIRPGRDVHHHERQRPSQPRWVSRFTGAADRTGPDPGQCALRALTQLSKLPNAGDNALHGPLTLNTSSPGATQPRQAAARGKAKIRRPRPASSAVRCSRSPRPRSGLPSFARRVAEFRSSHLRHLQDQEGKPHRSGLQEETRPAVATRSSRAVRPNGRLQRVDDPRHDLEIADRCERTPFTIKGHRHRRRPRCSTNHHAADPPQLSRSSTTAEGKPHKKHK